MLSKLEHTLADLQVQIWSSTIAVTDSHL